MTISAKKETRWRRDIYQTLIPSITQGLERTGLVDNVELQIIINNQQVFQGIEVHYQRARHTNCTRFRGSIDGLFLANFHDRGITLEYPKVKGRNLVTARVNGITNYQGNRTGLVYELLKQANDQIWKFIDSSGQTQYYPPKEGYVEVKLEGPRKPR